VDSHFSNLKHRISFEKLVETNKMLTTTLIVTAKRPHANDLEISAAVPPGLGNTGGSILSLPPLLRFDFPHIKFWTREEWDDHKSRCYDPTLFFLPPLIHPSYHDNNPSHLPLHGYIPTIPTGPCHAFPPSHCHHHRLSYRPAPLPVYPDPDSAPNTSTHQASLIRSPRTLKHFLIPVLLIVRISDTFHLHHVSPRSHFTLVLYLDLLHVSYLELRLSRST
jgi:hypothetical protein